MTAVLITGSANRIGKATALFLASKGYDIFIHYCYSKDKALQLKSEIELLGQRAWLIQSNFLKFNAEAFTENMKATSVTPSLLINMASIFEPVAFGESSEKDIRGNWLIHCEVPYLLSQVFSTQCEKGSIINITDCNFYKKKYFAYSLTKNALEILTIMLAKELSGRFRVNAIAPGLILPPEDISEDHLSASINKIPQKRPGTIQEILDAIWFLIENDYVTGQIIKLDGGKTL